MRERGGDNGGDERISVKIDGDSKKKINRWKSLKEMKEYLRSEFEKKTKSVERNERQTYLHFAAYLGDADAAEILLIEDNAEVNAGDDDEWTALHLAAEKGHVDVAKVLIQNGADVNAVYKYDRTALQWAAEKGNVALILELLCLGAVIDKKALEHDNTSLLGQINDRMNLLRAGKRPETSLMSNNNNVQ